MNNKKIIKRLVDVLNTTIPKLAKDLHCSEGYLYSINSNRRAASTDFIGKIVKKYPKVNKEFLKGNSDVILLGSQPQKEVLPKTPGERIRYIRKAKGLTQKAFAKELKSNFQKISAFESNHRLPSLQFLLLMKKKGMISSIDEVIDGTVTSPEVERLNKRIVDLERRLSDLSLEYERFRKVSLNVV